jgi:NADH dehydrogenase/NADH:ubiquinone oxidoreductase subunit G
MQFANMNPQSRIAAGIYGGLTQASRALGSRDPMLEQASQLRQLAQQFDTTTAEGMMQYANALRQVNPQAAQQAAMQAQQMMQTETKTALVRQQAVREEAKNVRDVRLQEELAALPEGASDDDVLNVVRKYGSPDKILASIERKAASKAAADAKAQVEREKIEAAKEREREKIEARKELATLVGSQRNAVTDLQRQLLQDKVDAQRQKVADLEDKKKVAQSNEEAKAQNVIGIIDNVLPKISGLNTAGVAGKALSFVPGSDAYDVARNIETIKANIGFKELSDMRQASPTGGALGQVAVQELNFLQAAISNLDVGQSPQQLRDNLSKVKKHYNRWLTTIRGEIPPEDKETAAAPAEGKTVKRTGVVQSGPNAGKRVIEYTDGTREFQ